MASVGDPIDLGATLQAIYAFRKLGAGHASQSGLQFLNRIVDAATLREAKLSGRCRFQPVCLGIFSSACACHRRAKMLMYRILGRYGKTLCADYTPVLAPYGQTLRPYRLDASSPLRTQSGTLRWPPRVRNSP